MKKLLMKKLAKAKKYINKNNEDEIWLKKTQNGWNLKKNHFKNDVKQNK
jgi:hypothetical protein